VSIRVPTASDGAQYDAHCAIVSIRISPASHGAQSDVHGASSKRADHVDITLFDAQMASSAVVQ